ncbi:MAG TPA: CBS domain-containing protein [Balneolaceae bacterium]|nr:CBS domain-containing protein [Balneolaceae bacterium]
MLAEKLINRDFEPLKPDDTVSSAIAKMDAWQTSSVPVIEPSTKKVIGHVLFETVANISDVKTKLSDVEWRPALYTFKTQHVFEVARQMLQHEVRILAVTDEMETYQGIIEKKSVLEALSAMLNIGSSGSVITIMMEKPDFTLSKLVHLIETENAKILGLTVEQPEDEESLLQVSIKLNLEDTSAITSSLKRYGFVVTSVAKQDLLQVDMTSRANELIRYLDL